MVSMWFHRRSLHQLKALCIIVILCSSIFPVAVYGVSLINGIQNSGEYGSCGTCKKLHDLGYSVSITNDASFGCMCTKPHSFLFPSSMSNFSDEENNGIAAPLEDQSSHLCDGTLDIEPTQHNISVNNKSWSSVLGMFRLPDGGIVSCSLNSREGRHRLLSLRIDGADEHNLSFCTSSFLKKKTDHIGSKDTDVAKPVYGSSLPNVEITPPFLDWGNIYLYFSSTVFLTMKNTCNHSILHIHEPFSTDTQFFSCEFNEISIGPGESASLCFVFSPRLLGETSAHLILQTNLGGFVIKATGYAIESSLVIQPLNGLDVSPGGKLRQNLSLFNPFNETIYVEEVTAWILVYQGQSSHLTEAVCSINSSQVVDQRNWEIGPHTSEAVMETEFSVGFEGRVIGAFCLQLLMASNNKSDIVMVPFKAESAIDQDTSQTIVTISLKNDGQDMCVSHQRFASVGHKHDNDSGITRSCYDCSNKNLDPQTKTQQVVQLEESMLGNWKYRGTTETMSVLKTHVVCFLMSQVGSYISKWITVKNPCLYRVVDHCEVVDECRSTDGSSLSLSSSCSPITEAFLHPHGATSLLDGSEIIRHIHLNTNVSISLYFDLPCPCAGEKMEDIPLDVKSIEVTGSKCQLEGFVVHSCVGFILEPGVPVKLMISCESHCSVVTLHRDLELSMADCILLVPLKATCPPSMPSNCRRLMNWMQTKESFVVFLLIALSVLCVCCLPLQFMTGGSPDSICKNQKISTALDRETNDFHHKDMEGTVPLMRMDAFDVVEASELGKLTIKTVTEKGKRRRKRKGHAAKFNGLFEASSSQSGNSTPSSPLSPFTAHVADESCQKGHASGAGAATKIPVKNSSNNNLFLLPQDHNPSATFPFANKATPYAFFHSPSLASTSTIPLHDRAPGSKLSSPKTPKSEEKAKPRDEYAYDIWGDHFSGLHLLGSSKYVAPLIHNPAGSSSNSFFVGGPQILTPPKSVLSFNQEGK